MLGILILMALSYILLHFTNKQLTLSTLLHTSKTFTTLAIGLTWPIIYFCSYELLLGWLVANPYVLNAHSHSPRELQRYSISFVR